MDRYGYGITRAELAASLRGAARGAARSGNAELARNLRAHAERAREAGPAPYARPWPYPPKGQSIWSLYKSASAVRRAHARWREKWRQEERYAVAHRLAFKLGNRKLLAMTCVRCGFLMPGEKFKRHIRNRTDAIEYIDRRCPNCKWGSRANGKREDQNEGVAGAG